MLSARSELADDVCPVREELLGELHRANDLFVPGFVYALAPDIRASHYSAIGAATCIPLGWPSLPITTKRV